MTTTANFVSFQDARHSGSWQKWHELAASAPPFLAPEFFALSRPLAARGEPFVACAWRGDALIGALPLFLSDHTLEALRTDQTPGFDYWGDPDGLAGIWESLERDARWDVLVLKNVPAASVLVKHLPEVARAKGAQVMIRPGARHAYFPLGDFQKHVNHKFLVNLRRCSRKAGGVNFERITCPTHADLRDAFEIEAMGWKAVAGTNIRSDPRTMHLYEALSRYFGPRGQATVSFLNASGRRIAMLFSLEDSHTLYGLKLGYDPSQYALSPGHMMVWQAALDAERRGLREFNFVGNLDDWKRKWTDLTRDQVSVVIYRNSPRGLVLYALREQLKPHLPQHLSDLHSPLRHGCQRNDIVGVHSLVERVRGRIDRGLGIKSGVRRLVHPPPPVKDAMGTPSSFAPGSWVRVVDEAGVRATLDANSRLRGLSFTGSQWDTMGQVYRVQKHVRRLRDDHGRFRPVNGTVLLEGVTCAGSGPEPKGCGRHCPMMYRDEWLEAAEPPHRPAQIHSSAQHARVRAAEDIRQGLDLSGRQDGLTFMPEMAQYENRRLAVATQLDSVFEYDRWVKPRAPIYILEGVNCSGSVFDARGGCHRACALLWHTDWLILETDGKATE